LQCVPRSIKRQVLVSERHFDPKRGEIRPIRPPAPHEAQA